MINNLFWLLSIGCRQCCALLCARWRWCYWCAYRSNHVDAVDRWLVRISARFRLASLLPIHCDAWHYVGIRLIENGYEYSSFIVNHVQMNSILLNILSGHCLFIIYLLAFRHSSVYLIITDDFLYFTFDCACL